MAAGTLGKAALLRPHSVGFTGEGGSGFPSECSHPQCDSRKSEFSQEALWCEVGWSLASALQSWECQGRLQGSVLAQACSPGTRDNFYLSLWWGFQQQQGPSEQCLTETAWSVEGVCSGVMGRQLRNFIPGSHQQTCERQNELIY